MMTLVELLQQAASESDTPNTSIEGKAANLIERQAAQIEMMREVLAYVKDACLYSDDDGAIGVTQEPHIDSLAFDMICKALTTTSDQALEQFATKANRFISRRG